MSRKPRVPAPKLIKGVLCKRLVPRRSKDDNDRVTIWIPMHEYMKHQQQPRGSRQTIVVTDQRTGTRWNIRPAPCGLQCYCDAFVTPASEE